MRKLKLELDALRVESFEAAAPPVARGTVEAQAFTRLQSNCASCGGGDCSSIPNPCFCTEALSCRCQ